MAYSYLSKSDRHERIEDFSLLILLHLMYRELETARDDGVESSYLRAELERLFQGYGPGCINLDLDHIVANRSIRERFLQLLVAIEKHLISIGEKYPPVQLMVGWPIPGMLIFEHKNDDTHSLIAKVRSLVGE